jgi:hypothetical protein
VKQVTVILVAELFSCKLHKHVVRRNPSCTQDWRVIEIENALELLKLQYFQIKRNNVNWSRKVCHWCKRYCGSLFVTFIVSGDLNIVNITLVFVTHPERRVTLENLELSEMPVICLQLLVFLVFKHYLQRLSRLSRIYKIIINSNIIKF